MLRHDIDGELVWLTESDYQEEKPALVLDKHEDGYTVFWSTIHGEKRSQAFFARLGKALEHFAAQLPE